MKKKQEGSVLHASIRNYFFERTISTITIRARIPIPAAIRTILSAIKSDDDSTPSIGS